VGGKCWLAEQPKSSPTMMMTTTDSCDHHNWTWQYRVQIDSTLTAIERMPMRAVEQGSVTRDAIRPGGEGTPSHDTTPARMFAYTPVLVACGQFLAVKLSLSGAHCLYCLANVSAR